MARAAIIECESNTQPGLMIGGVSRTANSIVRNALVLIEMRQHQPAMEALLFFIRRREMAASIYEYLAPQLQLIVLGGIFGELYGAHAGQNLP